MRRSGSFALALAFGIALAVAAVAGTVSRQDEPGLPVGELLRLEAVPGQVSTPLDDQVQYLSEALGGTRRVTADEYEERFGPEFAPQFFESEQEDPADSLNRTFDALFADGGTIGFVRVRERQPGYVRILAAAEDGTPRDIGVFSTDDDRIVFLTLHVDETHRRRLLAWQSVLILVAGVGSVAAAAVAWRFVANRQAWTLLAASIPALAAVGVLYDSRAIYTAGRVLPSLLVVVAVALLLDTRAGRPPRWVAAAAVAAAVLGALAPFVGDSLRIGHPAVVGALTDNAGLYRLLLASSAGLTVVAMTGVAVVNAGRFGLTGGWSKPALWITTSIAAVWSLAALGAAVDYGLGDGTLASGPFEAVTLAAAAAIPAAVLFRLVVSRWERPELAALVIDLEGEGVDLQPAVAKALDDPTLQVLTSPDGDHLLNDSGDQVSSDDIGDGRALTRIQSGPHLVGGLVHNAGLQRDPERLEAVAAAAGMAMELSQLNERVVAQLDEVNASRARILQASDIARRQVERDLHDGAQQRMVAHGLDLQRACRLAGARGQDDLASLLHEATQHVRETIEEIRAVSRGRQPSLLAERGLATAVDALAERASVPVHIEISARQLPEDVERAAYYIIAEGLTNMAKHAEASSAQVSITSNDGDALVMICDDGRGGARMSPGSGLEGLKDRVAATGGAFDISSGSEGTTLTAKIPCRSRGEP
ncbi:MAG: sensor histidine kinase [Acidimicrobiales bacterium]